MQNAGFILTDTGLSLFLDQQAYVVPQDHMNFEKIKAALRSREYDLLPGLIDVTGAMEEWAGEPGFEVIGDRVYLDGTPFTDPVSQKVLRMIETGLDSSPLIRFLRKVRENPSSSAQRELLLFCEANGFVIHEDGDIIAYKGVRDDYLDCHSESIDNSIGREVVMARGEVDDRRDVTCSVGLHFASYAYARNWGRRLMVLKINPRDVVSIPNDYDNMKGRCCRYVVIGEMSGRESLTHQEVYTDADIQPVPHPDDRFSEEWTR